METPARAALTLRTPGPGGRKARGAIEELIEPDPGSGWPALRDALSHMTWGYVRWLADPAGTSGEPEVRLSSWDELGHYRRPAKIFAHATLHERQHHADVNTLLSRLGIEVPIVEFRFALRGRGL